MKAAAIGFLLAASIVALAIFAVVAIDAADTRAAQKSNLPPWTVVCDQGKKFSFVADDGSVWDLREFDSASEARAYMIRIKDVSDDRNQRLKADAERDAAVQADVAARHWAVCPEAAP